MAVNPRANLVSRYISRGVAFSDRPSFQPSVTIRVALPELPGGIVTSASVFVGNWNSIQFDGPGLGQPSSGRLSGWYEADLYAGATVELHDELTISATYFRYESPAHSFRAYNDLELIVRYDDAALWRDILPGTDFTLSPTLRLVQAGRPDRKDALYVQPSLTPAVRLGTDDQAVQIAVPLVVGLSKDYYRAIGGGKERFGFFRTGVTISGKPFPARSEFSVQGGFDLWLLNKRVVSGWITGR